VRTFPSFLGPASSMIAVDAHILKVKYCKYLGVMFLRLVRTHENFTLLSFKVLFSAHCN